VLNVAFWSSVIVAAALVGGIYWYMGRRPVGTPLTWGEAMVAAVYVFFLLFWMYGVVPHQWLTWADNELRWRPDKIFLQPRAKTAACSWKWGTAKGCIKWPLPITVSWQTMRDLVAVGIYGIELGGMGMLWVKWQKRGQKAPVAVEKSEFGRPLVREGSN
jgi:hypothetical protein